MLAPVLSIAGLRKSFATSRSLGALLRGRDATIVKVLDGIDLTLAAGEVITIEGGNGTGKSTLLRLAAGLLLPDAGRVSILGIDPGTQRRMATRQYNYVPGDDRGLPNRATVRQTLTLFASLRGFIGRTATSQICKNMEVLALDELADRRVAELSTGQRRRLQLASALFGDVKLLLLDEPTRGLDRELQTRLWAHLRSAAQTGVAILLATHSYEERTALSAAGMQLTNGKLVAL